MLFLVVQCCAVLFLVVSASVVLFCVIWVFSDALRGHVGVCGFFMFLFFVGVVLVSHMLRLLGVFSGYASLFISG